MEEVKKPIHISIDEILREKAGSKARFIPRFVTSWLKRTVHEDEVNRFLAASSGLTGVPWLRECVKYLDMKVEVIGENNLPPENDVKRYTFVCNHPLGGPDGVAIGAEIGERYHDNIRYILNDILTKLPGLAPLSVPINKTGAQSRRTPFLVDEVFKSDYNILLFPAGLCSRRHNGVVRDLPWKKTFVTKSVTSHRDVVPMHFSGGNSNRFYRIARLCEVLHSPVNFAMIYLVDEMYKNTHKKFQLKIGKPIPWQTFDSQRTPAQWAAYVEDICYDL